MLKALELIWVMLASFIEMFFLIMVSVFTIFRKILQNEIIKINQPEIKTSIFKRNPGWVIGPQNKPKLITILKKVKEKNNGKSK